MTARAKQSVARWWSRWLSRVGLDWLLSGGFVLLHVLAHVFNDVPPLLSGIPLADRPGLYTATAIIVTLSGTLGSTAVNQFMSGRGERMAELKRLYPGHLAATWRSLFLGSFAAAAALVTAYILDSRTSGPHWGTWLFEGAVLLTVLRFVRLSMLFSSVIEISARDDTDPLGGKVELTSELFQREPVDHR